ncbi:hypothetical protein BDY24DRAFT_390568, partial [Mrakia frigida]|uniref:uncharacterized protein n=1 Tax=Mrakia frigida TaxID=29902 RepID=UPI003FCC1BE7
MEDSLASAAASSTSFHVFLFVVALMLIAFIFFCFLSTCMGTSLRELIMQQPPPIRPGYRGVGQGRGVREREEFEMGM